MIAAKRFNAWIFYTAAFVLPIAACLALVALEPTGWAALAACAAIMAAAFGAGTWAYFRIDEAAREAQKSAWLWGGLAGALIALLLAVAMVLPEGPAFSILLPATPPAWMFFFGAVSVLVLQSVAYLIVWSVWWLSKR